MCYPSALARRAYFARLALFAGIFSLLFLVTWGGRLCPNLWLLADPVRGLTYENVLFGFPVLA